MYDHVCLFSLYVSLSLHQTFCSPTVHSPFAVLFVVIDRTRTLFPPVISFSQSNRFISQYPHITFCSRSVLFSTAHLTYCNIAVVFCWNELLSPFLLAVA